MKTRQILNNALSTFLQVIGSAAALFFLYRFLVRTIGVERLGIWSLVLATTSIVTLANQGFSTGIVKFVAKYAAREDTPRVSLLIETALVSMATAVGIVSVLLYPLGSWALRLILPAQRYPEAMAVLPFALASLWLNLCASVLQAGLAGHERIAQRNSLVLAASAAYVALAVAFVPSRGLTGLAEAQLITAAFSLVAAWIFLRRRVPALAILPHRFNRPLFREMFSFSLQFQLITAGQAAREPLTKALLAKFGGLVMTGLYDMAMRWVITFRELIVQANQVLVPTIAGLQERDPAAIPRVYRDSYRIVFYLSIPLFAFLTLVSPVVSRIWLGRSDPVFLAFVALLAAGWLVNILANPAYVVDLATGDLRSIRAGCVLTIAMNLFLGYFGGKYFGGLAVVSAAAVSLIAGYLVILIAYHRAHRIPFSVLFPRDSARLVLASFLVLALFFPYLHSSRAHSLQSLPVASAVLVSLILVILPMWLHPMRRRLFNWLVSHSHA
ncbi:MAG TPA: lipopolysaccharide biosynthesis protein [Candidatus Micrarchaeaceae archaeon]|nr:lipopolysaccharide biosynthesis protein [Candidatus Micrarchaeaceae archaeon]